MASLLLLSPIALGVAWIFVRLSIRDEFISDHKMSLIVWGLAMIAIALLATQASSTTRSLVLPFIPSVLLIATLTLSGLYGVAAIASHRSAVAAGAPERTFEILIRRRQRNGGDYFLHQRQDGSAFENNSHGTPIPYAKTCALVQRLMGDYGFGWLRIVERSPPPANEIDWPIRREDCFSDKPLASLKA